QDLAGRGAGAAAEPAQQVQQHTDALLARARQPEPPGPGAGAPLDLGERNLWVVEAIQGLEQPERDPGRAHRHPSSVRATRARHRLESVPEPSSNTVLLGLYGGGAT